MIDLNKKIVTDDGRPVRSLHSTWGEAAMPGLKLVLVVIGQVDYALMYEDGSGRYVDENRRTLAGYFRNVEPEKNLVKRWDIVTHNGGRWRVIGMCGMVLWLKNTSEAENTTEAHFSDCTLDGKPIDGVKP